MERYISTLRKEALSSSGNKNIVQFKLGAFDDASDRDAFKLAVALRHDNPSDGTSDTTLAGPEQRHIRGTPLRELHLEVFDAIVSKRKGTVYVGRGSRMYDTLGKVMPEGLVGWMLGLQTQREEARKVESEEDKGSRAGSPGWERVDQVSGEESS